MSEAFEIRFVDITGHILFTVPDGSNITLTYFDGEQVTRKCKYLNEYHFEIGSAMYHIDEFASLMWRNGTVYAPEGKTPDIYEIYQITDNSVKYMFRSYDEAKNHFLGADYVRKYAGMLAPETTLDTIYSYHNRDHRPFAQSMRSASVSDIIVLRRDGKNTAHYVDLLAFSEAPQFLENIQRNVMLQVEEAESKLFYRMDGETAERHGALGYLRVDFGRSGQEFYQTWFDIQKHLKTPVFKDSFTLLMNYLRSEIFEDRVAMKIFCGGNLGVSLGERGTGFKLHSAGYTYFMRCNPGQANYDAYLFVYDDRYLLPELAGQHELPKDCYSVLPSSGDLVLIVRDKQGYYPSPNSTAFSDINRKIADESNTHFGVTRAQEEAMLAGSMFGWNTPAAKPWQYEPDGKPRTLPPKNRDDQER